MKKYVNTSFIYTIVAMVLGVFYREFTSLRGFVGVTRLSVLHTHYFVLGMIMFLIFAGLEAVTHFSEEKFGKIFFVLYNIGLNITGATLFARGFYQVTTPELARGLDMSISGIAGIGHTILGIGMVLFFLALRKAVAKKAV